LNPPTAELMQELPLILALLVPLTGAIVQVFFLGNLRVQRVTGVVASGVLLAAGVWLVATVREAGPLRIDLGGWDAPTGIRLHADMLAAVMIAITGLIGFCGAIHALAEVTENEARRGHHPVYQMLLLGVCGAFLTGDLFNLFVWFEVMLLSSFVLLSLGGGRAQIEGAVKFVTLNIVASFVFLVGTGLIYGSVGSLNYADIAQRLGEGGIDGAGVRAASVLLFLSFAIKSALFPIFAWLPSSYHTPSHTVSAVMGGLGTKVGVYALYRTFGQTLADDGGFLMPLLFWVSILTMVVGGLGAASQFHTRRILSFHIISQVGYMTFALTLGTTAAIAAGLFFILHNILAKTNLFFAASVIDRIGGGEDLKRVGGLYRRAPWLGILFLISALSLAGIPPLSGFWAKFALVRETLGLAVYFGAAMLIATGVLTLFSMTKLWAEAFWKDRPEETDADRPVTAAHVVPMVILAAAILWVGFLPGLLFELCDTAATQLLNPGPPAAP